MNKDLETVKIGEIKGRKIISAEVFRTEDGQYCPVLRVWGRKDPVAIEKKRGGLRVYHNLSNLAGLLKEMGVERFDVVLN